MLTLHSAIPACWHIEVFHYAALIAINERLFSIVEKSAVMIIEFGAGN